MTRAYFINFSKIDIMLPTLVAYKSINPLGDDKEKSPVQNTGEETSNKSVYESIDEISKHEIESRKDEIKSKLINIDYETYIKQFTPPAGPSPAYLQGRAGGGGGLLGGDGTISVSSPGPNH
jgi:hypothetical protein